MDFEARDLVFASDVAGEDGGVGAALAGRFVEFGGVSADKRDAAPFASQRDRHGSAQTPAGASDEGALPGQELRHFRVKLLRFGPL
jgi:hypothetical protein